MGQCRVWVFWFGDLRVLGVGGSSLEVPFRFHFYFPPHDGAGN